MRILFVFSIYLPLTGGCQDPIDQVASYATSTGHELHVLTKQWPIDLPREEIINTVHVHRIKSAILPEELVSMTHEVRKVIDYIQPEVIHVIGLRRPLPFFALMAARYCKCPVIMTVGGWDVPDPADPEPGKVWNSGKHLIRESMLQADELNAASKDLTRLIQLEFPEKCNIPVMRVGINPEVFFNARPYQYKKPYIVSLRRLEASKQVDKVIEAFSVPSLRMRSLDLLIAGDGQEVGKLQYLVRSLNLEKRIKFLGEVDIYRAASLLKGAEATVVASKTEGGGLINVEAQAAGIPIIATKVGGILEYVGGKGGAHFLESDTPLEIAEGIIRCMDDIAYRDRLILSGRANVNNFDMRVLFDGYLNTYETLKDEAYHKNFIPWSKLTQNLWNIFRYQENKLEVSSQRYHMSLPYELQKYGESAKRWWYTRTEMMDNFYWTEMDKQIIDDIGESINDDAFGKILDESAEWGRVTTEELMKYALGVDEKNEI